MSPDEIAAWIAGTLNDPWYLNISKTYLSYKFTIKIIDHFLHLLICCWFAKYFSAFHNTSVQNIGISTDWLTVLPSGNFLISPYTVTVLSVDRIRASYVWHCKNTDSKWPNGEQLQWRVDEEWLHQYYTVRWQLLTHYWFHVGFSPTAAVMKHFKPLKLKMDGSICLGHLQSRGLSGKCTLLGQHRFIQYTPGINMVSFGM